MLLQPLHTCIDIELVSVIPWRVDHRTVLYLSVHSYSLCDSLCICQIGYVALSVPSYYECIQRIGTVEVGCSSYPCQVIRQREADNSTAHYKPQLKCGASTCAHVGRSERDTLTRHNSVLIDIVRCRCERSAGLLCNVCTGRLCSWPSCSKVHVPCAAHTLAYCAQVHSHIDRNLRTCHSV